MLSQSISIEELCSTRPCLLVISEQSQVSQQFLLTLQLAYISTSKSPASSDIVLHAKNFLFNGLQPTLNNFCLKLKSSISVAFHHSDFISSWSYYTWVSPCLFFLSIIECVLIKYNNHFLVFIIRWRQARAISSATLLGEWPSQTCVSTARKDVMPMMSKTCKFLELS